MAAVHDHGRVVRIGGFSAFWGDTAGAAEQLVTKGGHLDYLIGDYLAEVTLCIMARIKAAALRRKKGKMKSQTTHESQSDTLVKAGYAPDFLTAVYQPLIRTLHTRKIKVITNAGGMNPLALKQAMEEAARRADLPVPVIAVVTGDDLLARLPELSATKKLHAFATLPGSEVEHMWPDAKKIISCNAYLGALPIVRALEDGAQFVITGRVVDSALVLAPLMYEFGWSSSDYNLLSAGSLVGHLIECGAQCTGGNFTDWYDSVAARRASGSPWADIGFPIAEVASNGTAIITKPNGTGGIVSPLSVGEQLVYEIGDPASYILPDVVCDWRCVTLRQVGPDRVQVCGARGLMPPPHYKVGAVMHGGFVVSAMLFVSGFDTLQKAHLVADSILIRSRRLMSSQGFSDFDEVRVECLGADATYGESASVYGAHPSREICLRISVRHRDAKALRIFSGEVAPAATGSAPGLTGGGAGRSKPTPALEYYSCLVDKSAVPFMVHLGDSAPRSGDTCEGAITDVQGANLVSKESDTKVRGKAAECVSSVVESKGSILPPLERSGDFYVKVPLIALCVARSGDKGDNANIGVIAREARFFDWMKRVVTCDAVYGVFMHLLVSDSRIFRYELEGIHALNFVLTRSLGGGGVSSLHLDRQGKSYGQKLLALSVKVPHSWINGSKWAISQLKGRL